MDHDERLLGFPNEPKHDWRDWLGVRGKTLWDWMGLLIVPFFIAGATLVFSFFELWREDQRVQGQQQIEADRAQQNILQSYIHDMTALMLDRGLATSNPDSLVTQIARANTVSVIRRLDSGRRDILLRFLFDSNLLKAGSVTLLSGTDLSGANLWDTNLEGAYLRGTNLSRANLGSANLWDTNLSRANLSVANLSDALLTGADLTYANLSGANLTGADLSDLFPFGFSPVNLSYADLSHADLSGAKLNRADLSGANLSGANLRGTNLRGTNLSGAHGWTNEQLAQAGTLVGATLADGTKMTRELWEEFKKSYRQ